MVHLGRNPITTKGWEEFKNLFIDEDAATGSGQGKSNITRNQYFLLHSLILYACFSVTKITKFLFTIHF